MRQAAKQPSQFGVAAKAPPKRPPVAPAGSSSQAGTYHRTVPSSHNAGASTTHSNRSPSPSSMKMARSTKQQSSAVSASTAEPPKRTINTKPGKTTVVNTQSQSSSHMQPANSNQTPPPQHFIGQSQRIQQEEYPFDQINNLIHEYLLKNNLVKTLDTFQDELTQPLPVYDQSRGYEYQLMEHFKKGQRDEFFMKWNRFLPLSLLVGDEKVTRLEFYLQIFFFIFPIHPYFRRQTEIDSDSANYFKEYLETRGAALSKTSEFLHYYALPYIPRPQEHAALQHLFQNSWIEGVRFQLNEFLSSVYDNQPLPLLFYVYQNYLGMQSSSTQLGGGIGAAGGQSFNQESLGGGGISDGNATVLQNENKELINVVKQFNEKYMMLQNHSRMVAEQNKQIIIESHQKWIVIANELVNISKNMKGMIDSNRLQGVEFNSESLNQLSSRIEKYESFLSMNIEDLISQSQDISLFDKQQQSFLNDGGARHSDLVGSKAQNYHPFQVVPSDPMKYDNPYCALDFTRIKQIIAKQDDPILCCAILQALRWRVSRARGAYVRREIIVAYATFDIIGCENPEDQVLQEALFSRDSRVQEFSLRLINAMASDFSGRTYLIKSSNLAVILIHILRTEKEDSFTRRNALGTLQKLSLRRKPQIAMINNDLISWIVNTLRDEKDTLSEYSYEYATALFMNLSLRSSGKVKCEAPEGGVLNVLNDLLEHENLQVRTFVNGTLYSLLGRQSLREQARAIGMNEILAYLMESSDERFTKQIQYIMDQLNKEKVDDDALSDSNEEDNDVDDIDDEEEIGEDEQADDVIEPTPKMLFGEDLLFSKYKLEGAEALKQQSVTRRIIQESHQQRMISSANTNVRQSYTGHSRGGGLDIPFNRPATPSMSASYISHSQKTSQNYRSHPSQQQQRSQNIRTPVDMQQRGYTPIDQQQRGYTPQSFESGSKLNQGSQEDQPGGIPESNAEEEEIRNLPSEMRSRPRILRTPAGDERKRIQYLQKQHEQMQHQSFTEQATNYPAPVKKEKPLAKTNSSPQTTKQTEKQINQSQQLQHQQKLQQQLQQPKPQPTRDQPLVNDALKPSLPTPLNETPVPIEIAFDSKPKIPRTPPGLQK